MQERDYGDRERGMGRNENRRRDQSEWFNRNERYRDQSEGYPQYQERQAQSWGSDWRNQNDRYGYGAEESERQGMGQSRGWSPSQWSPDSMDRDSSGRDYLGSESWSRGYGRTRFGERDYEAASPGARNFYDERDNYGGAGGWDRMSSGTRYRQGYGQGQSRGMMSRSSYGSHSYGTPGALSEFSESDRHHSFGGSGMSHTGRGPKSYKRSDERIREDVVERLTDHPELNAEDIDVEVQECIVTLSGAVDNRQDRRLAEEIAENVWGVTDVKNEIKSTSGNAKSNRFRKGQEADDASSRETSGSGGGSKKKVA